MSKKLNSNTRTSIDNELDPRSMGAKTRKILKKNKVVSPEIKASQGVEIKKGLWVYPKNDLMTKKEVNEFINKKKELYGIK